MKREIPTPPGIRKECLNDPLLFRRYGEVVSAYDPKLSIGGIYNLNDEEWILFFPITPELFAGRVAKVTAAVEINKIKSNNVDSNDRMH